MIPSELAAVESASGIALQMMLVWQSWKIEDRHIHVGCPQMIMTSVEPQDRGNDSAHRLAHDVDPPCGGWFMDTTDADQYWSRYEELGDVDVECPLSASDDVFEELGDASDEDCMTDTLDFQDDDSVDTFFRSFFNKSMGLSLHTLGVYDSIHPTAVLRVRNIPPNHPVSACAIASG